MLGTVLGPSVRGIINATFTTATLLLLHHYLIDCSYNKDWSWGTFIANRPIPITNGYKGYKWKHGIFTYVNVVNQLTVKVWFFS